MTTRSASEFTEIRYDDESQTTMTTATYDPTDRDTAIKTIRAALKGRTGRTWSVTGGRGSGWGWITVHAPPARRTGIMVEDGVYPDGPRVGDTRYKLVDSGIRQDYGYMTPDDLATLRDAIGDDDGSRVSQQGWLIPASGAYRREAIARCEGRTPDVYGAPYWD